MEKAKIGGLAFFFYCVVNYGKVVATTKSKSSSKATFSLPFPNVHHFDLSWHSKSRVFNPTANVT